MRKPSRKEMTAEEWEDYVIECLRELPPAKDTETFTAEEWTAFRRAVIEASMMKAGYRRADSEDRLKVQDALDHTWGGLTQEEAGSIANYRGGYVWK